jgi:hypothetical protein
VDARADATWCEWVVSTAAGDDKLEFCHLNPKKCRASCHDEQTRKLVESRVQSTQSIFHDLSWRPSPNSGIKDYWQQDLDQFASRSARI